MSLFPEPAQPRPLTTATTRMTAELRHDSPFLSCRFDPTGRFVFAGAEDSTVQRFEVANSRKVALAGHESWVRGMDFIRGRNVLVSGGYDGKLIWWQADADEPRPLRTVEAHDGWVRAVAVSPDGELVASCGNDNLVKLWAAADGRPVRTLRGHESHVYNVAFHPEGRFLVSADHLGNIKQWDHAAGRETRTLDARLLHRDDPTFRAILGGVRGMAFQADGSRLACTGITNVSNAFAGIGNPAVVVFDWETGRSRVLRPAAAFRGTGWGVAFHPAGALVGVGGGAGGELWFWRPDQEQPFATVRLPNNARDLSLSPDGRQAAVAFYDRMVRVWSVELS